MKKLFLSLVFIGFISNLCGDSIATLAQQFNLYPGTKATVQWERVFSSEKRLKQYGLDTLEYNKLIELKYYLIQHAADSKQPILPGMKIGYMHTNENSTVNGWHFVQSAIKEGAQDVLFLSLTAEF